ncbi:unnamed protein product [Scytosiphon promiscuus]
MSALVIGLVAGLVVSGVLIFCCVRSICKDKKAISRQVKQVQQVDEDATYDDVEAPTPPLEEQLRGPSATSTKTTSAAAAPPAKKASASRAPVDDAPPSYDELEPAAVPKKQVEHVYGDDSDEFKGRHDYQTASDPYDAPVRVSRSTERRSGSNRTLSPTGQSRASSSSSSSSRGRNGLAARVGS